MAPMLVAKRRTSRFSHVTASGGYSCPAPGADIFWKCLLVEYYLYRLIVSRQDLECQKELSLLSK